MSERWAQEFELRAQAHWTEEAVHCVTEGKDLPILPSNAPTLLRALGLLHRDASMPPPQVRKFLQLNRMIRMLRPLLLELIARGEPRRLVDAGCGLSYLTLSLAWCWRHVFQHPATLVGIARDAARVASGVPAVLGSPSGAGDDTRPGGDRAGARRGGAAFGGSGAGGLPGAASRGRARRRQRGRRGVMAAGAP